MLIVSRRLRLTLQAATPTYQNVTSTPQTTPLPTSPPTNGSCQADCLLKIPFNEDWYWSKLFVSTTLTAATKYVIINKKTNTTSTKIVYADLPEGFTLPPTNPEGTQALFTTFGDLTTTLVYPTPYLSWDSGYSWGGTLPTIDNAGRSVCSTITGSTSESRTFTYNTQIPVTTQQVTTTDDDGSTVITTDISYTRVPQTTFVSTSEIPAFTVVPYGETFQRTVPPADPNDPYGFL